MSRWAYTVTTHAIVMIGSRSAEGNSPSTMPASVIVGGLGLSASVLGPVGKRHRLSSCTRGTAVLETSTATPYRILDAHERTRPAIRMLNDETLRAPPNYT